MDVFNRKKRSEIMSKIHGKNTKVELVFYDAVRKRGIKGFKRHYDIIGTPDLAFPKIKVAVFIDGDFWHGKDFLKWKNKLSPFWFNKINNNIKRDRLVKKKLTAKGWRILRFWDVEITRNVKKCVDQLEKILHDK